ncbi:killer cell lectin-like receptor subfamily F member 1 [Porphyrio hochstetteri]
MAADITYVDVAMLPRERPHAPSQGSVPGNTITYAELRVKPKPKGSRRSEPSASGCQHRRSPWFYVVLVLGFLVLILLGIIAILSKPLLKGRAGKPESVSQGGLNRTVSLMSSEKTDLDKLLKWIKEELCNCGWGEERKTCELCPPGWQLHSGRCYYFSEVSLSWNDSEKHCLDSSSQLLVFENAAEMDFIDKKEKDNRYIWLGRIEDIKKQWISDAGSGLNEMRTDINKIETDRNCPVYRRKYTVQGDNCQTLKKWICKKNAFVFTL